MGERVTDACGAVQYHPRRGRPSFGDGTEAEQHPHDSRSLRTYVGGTEEA